MKTKAVRKFSLSLLALLIIAIFFYLNFTTVIVSGQSMEPTFRNGQRLLACKAYWLVGGIKDKDVVVIKAPVGYIIKRVYKTQGETVDFANVQEDYNIADGEYHVPPDNVWVLGDNRPVSEDSRKFGPIPLSSILGKVIKL